MQDLYDAVAKQMSMVNNSEVKADNIVLLHAGNELSDFKQELSKLKKNTVIYIRMKLSKATTAQKSAEAAKLPEGYDGVLRNHQQALNNFTRHINASDLPLAMMSLDYALNSFKLRPEDQLKAYKTIGERRLGFGDDDIFIKKENLTRHLKNFVEKEDYALMIQREF